MTAPRPRLVLFSFVCVLFATHPAVASGHAEVLQTFSLPASIGNLTEPAIAVDPRDPKRLQVLATDYAGSVAAVAGEQVRIAPTCRLSESKNLGHTWTSSDFAGSHAPAVPYVSSSNATLATDSRGRFYAACLANNSAAGGAVVFGTGTLGSGISRSQLLSTPGAGPLVTADKPWVAASLDGSSVAVVWAEFVSNPGAAVIVARVSHDNGLTFEPPHVVSSAVAGNGHEVVTSSGLPCAIYLRSGALAVAWHASLATGEDVMAITMDSGSTNPPSTIALRNVAHSGVQGQYPRHANQPSLALDPRGQGVLLAGGVQTPGGVRAELVAVQASGVIAGAPIAVAPLPGGGDQLNAAVGTTGPGAVGVAYQQVKSGYLETLLALRGTTARSWKPIRISTRNTPVSPYTASSNGTPIGDFIMVVGAGARLISVFPEQQGPRLQLVGVIVSAT